MINLFKFLNNVLILGKVQKYTKIISYKCETMSLREESTDITTNTWEPLHQIEDHLYLGNWHSATDQQILATHKIRRVLTITDTPIPDWKRHTNIEYFHIKLNDMPEEDLLSHFEVTRNVIADGQTNGHNVLVHCHAGISRSSTVVTAYLMNKYDKPFVEALDMVRIKRPFISPNIGFRDQLRLYEEMGNQLNAKNKRYRRFVYDRMLADSNVEHYWTQLDKYFKRRDYIESLVKLDASSVGRQYQCLKCNQLICQEIHVIENLQLIDSYVNNNNDKVAKSCGNIYIEPQKWMLPLNIGDQHLNCQKCGQVLGAYNLSNGSKQLCNCLKHTDITGYQFMIEKNCFKII
ncbi:dual specificity protein phosphatase MPK-4-like [Oppia nitens]|uniref:dual specificity protein phosphatase MPK-4-like n=1 Tax=Oppia nitens TaxID=1686743 RepID=UPI0023DBE5F8|nr:dual specificity protein phosphatase MPK-4-like [Oppia nitens]